MSKQRKWIACGAVVILLIVGIFHLQTNETTAFDEEYLNYSVINEDILLSHAEWVSKIQVNETDKSRRFLVCSTEKENLMLLILDNELTPLRIAIYDPSGLITNKSISETRNIPASKDMLVFNLFLNPTSDSVSVDGNTHPVFAFDHSYNGKTLKIGFWYDIAYA